MEHEKLTQQVLEMQRKLASGKSSLTLEVMQFLSDWLRNHIQIQDQKVSAYVKKQKAGGAPAHV